MKLAHSIALSLHARYGVSNDSDFIEDNDGHFLSIEYYNIHSDRNFVFITGCHCFILTSKLWPLYILKSTHKNKHVCSFVGIHVYNV